MPFEVRKNMIHMNFTPQSLRDAPCDNEDMEDDFVQDPDQVKDLLPQPYRMIDKIVNSLFDRTWNYISNREEERVAEATRDRPPQYECGVKLQDHGTACCMQSSPNGGDVIVMGLPNGLAVIQSATQKTLCTYHEDKMEIVTIHISNIGEHMHLISTIDDMGVGRIFALHGHYLYLVQTIAEGDGGAKAVVSQCEVSQDGEYLGLCFENSANNEVWLEMHKVPKDQLVKELESVGSRDAARKGASSPLTEENETAGVTEEEDDQPRSNTPISRSGSATQTHSSHKFPACNVILKIKQPQPVAGTVWTSALTASKAIDATGDIIGSGAHHLVSSQHLEQRDTVFQQMHQEHARYTQQQEQQEQQQQGTMAEPMFHFVSGGRLMPHGVSNTDPAGPITAAIVWWHNQPQVAFYSLAKPAKELEHKAEMVWPLAALPATSAVSACTSLFAIATHSNNVLIWDKYMGQPRPIEHMAVSGSISTLQWLPLDSTTAASGVADDEDKEEAGAAGTYPPYRVCVAASLLVTSTAGDMVLLRSRGPGTSAPTAPNPMRDVLQQAASSRTSISSDIQKPDETFTQLITVDGIPQLLVSVRRNGRVFLQDVLTTEGKRSLICEVTLPHGFSLPTSWEPALAVGAHGSMLYIRGHHEQQQALPSPRTTTPQHAELCIEEGEPGSNQSLTEDVAVLEEAAPVDAVFVFALRSFHTLDKYRPPAPTTATAVPSLHAALPSVTMVETPQQQQQQQQGAGAGAGAGAGQQFMIHCTAEMRVAALLAERLRVQTGRKDVMQGRWQQLKDELHLIQEMRRATEKRHTVTKPMFSASSIGRIPLI